MMRTNTTGGQHDRRAMASLPGHETYTPSTDRVSGMACITCRCGAVKTLRAWDMTTTEASNLHAAHVFNVLQGNEEQGANPLPRGPVEPMGGMHGLDGKPAARCYTCSWTQPADNRGDALLMISRHLNEEHDGGRVDVREPGALLSGGRMPQIDRRVTVESVHESLQGNFDGLPAEDAELMLSVLAALYPQGASLSACEAAEALLRAGFSRGHR